jgi:hypothetical protein
MGPEPYGLARKKIVTEFYQHPHVFLMRIRVVRADFGVKERDELGSEAASNQQGGHDEFFSASSFFLYEVFALLVLIRNDRTTLGWETTPRPSLKL